MKIALLEWLCGGGAQVFGEEDSADSCTDGNSSLLREGWGMLSCIAEGLVGSEFQPHLLVDDALFAMLSDGSIKSDRAEMFVPGAGLGEFANQGPSPAGAHGRGRGNKGELSQVDLRRGNFGRSDLGDGLNATLLSQIDTSAKTVDDVIQVWGKFASEMDAAILIAPEIDGILETCVQELGSRVPLLNCSGRTLELAADKLKFAQLLNSQESRQHDFVRSVPTVTLEQANLSWLRQSQSMHADSLATATAEKSAGWIVKSRRGAGCDGMRWFDNPVHVLEFGSELDRRHWLVQPMIGGTAYSCHAIVDASRTWHWLPLTRQEIYVNRQTGCDNGTHRPLGEVRYAGSSLVEPGSIRSTVEQRVRFELVQGELERLFIDNDDGALVDGALGWIGFDLVLSDRGEWFVIECNSRCTTSLIELSRSYSGNLPTELVSLSLGKATSLAGHWG